MAMWQIYSSPGSVALKVSALGLRKQLNKDLASQPFLGDLIELVMGKVEYMPLSNPVKYRALRKNSSYKHENEIRLVAKVNASFQDKMGLKFKLTDLRSLKLKIIAHPATLDWELQNLTQIKKNLIMRTVQRSSLHSTIKETRS